MIKPKRHISKIFRTPAVSESRMDYLRMDKNEFLPAWPREWFRDAMKRLKSEHLSVHPEPRALYGKIARTLGLSEDGLVLTAGSDAAIRSVFEVFVKPGDRVVIPDPTFAMYYVYSSIYRASLVKIPYDRELRLDIEKLIDSINPKTRLIAIANPNSPTGTVISRSDLRAVIEKASRVGSAVLLDEAYYPFYERTMLGTVNKYDNLIVTRTFSKAAGLAGARIGFAASNPGVTGMLFAVKPMYEVTSVSIVLAEYVMDNYDRVHEYADLTRKGKDVLAGYFDGKGYDVFNGFANFIHVDFGADTEGVVKHLSGRKVLFKSGFKDACLRRFCRFTCGPEEAVMPLIAAFNKFKAGRRK